MRFTFKVTGLERKQLAALIAETIGEQVIYAGAPTFQYHIGDWSIGKDCIVATPEPELLEEHVTLKTVLDALNIAGAKAEGNLTVTLPMAGHSGNSLRNLINLIFSKQHLIQKALARQEAIIPVSFVKVINAVPIESLEEFAEAVNNAIEAGEITENSDLDIDMADKVIRHSFFNASLDAQECRAFSILSLQLNEQAKKQKFSSIKQKESPNECYSMRCYLLKLGFIGAKYKAARRILLSKLDGSSAYAKPNKMRS